MRRGPVIVASGAFVVTSACGEPPFDGWRLDRTRVLAARVEAIAEPSRASLRPSEPARITWLVTGRAPPPRLAWAFAACVPPAGLRASPRCEGPALVSGSGASPGERAVMDLVVPPAEAAPGASELLVLAAFCTAGDVALDPRAFEATCASGERPLLATTRLPIATGAAPVNANPAIEAGAIRLGDAVWPEAAGSTCDGLPSVRVGTEVSVAVTPRPIDREVSPAGREALLLATFADAGELERQFTALEPEDEGDLVFPFVAPSAVGERVRLVFVLRDGRGGTSFTTRALCAAP